VVCERHWPKNYVTSRYRGKDRPIDPPSIFDCVKPSLVPTPPPFPRQTKRTHAEERNILPDEIKIFNEKDKITSFLSLKQNIKLQKFTVDAMINICENDIFIQSKEFLPNTCVNIYMLSIKNSFKYEAYHCGVKRTIISLSENKVYLLNRWSHIQEALNFLHNCKNKIINEQLQAMGVTYIGDKKYSPETIIRAFEYFVLSRTAYNRLREDFELPSISTLTRLTSKVKTLDDISYVKTLFQKLDSKQKLCVLILDEVYVKSMLQYHGGIVFGKAVNDPSQLANTILSFMIVCLYGGPKLVLSY